MILGFFLAAPRCRGSVLNRCAVVCAAAAAASGRRGFHELAGGGGGGGEESLGGLDALVDVLKIGRRATCVYL